jgi:hypothetical protein
MGIHAYHSPVYTAQTVCLDSPLLSPYTRRYYPSNTFSNSPNNREFALIRRYAIVYRIDPGQGQGRRGEYLAGNCLESPQNAECGAGGGGGQECPCGGLEAPDRGREGGTGAGMERVPHGECPVNAPRSPNAGRYRQNRPDAPKRQNDAQNRILARFPAFSPRTGAGGQGQGQGTSPPRILPPPDRGRGRLDRDRGTGGQGDRGTGAKENPPRFNPGRVVWRGTLWVNAPA